MSRRVLFLAIAVLIVAAAGSAGLGADSARDETNVSAFGELKPGAGREHVLAYCIPCHSTAVIVASHQSRERWDQTITRMQSQNGMRPLEPEIRAQILGYLATAQPPSDPGLEKGKETPWAGPLYRPNPLW